MARTGLLRAALACAVAGPLAACSSSGSGSGGLRETLGLSAPPPDPFLTVSRAPLELPPNLGELPQPRPGAPSRVEPNPTATAQAALGTGVTAPAPAAPTTAESALIAAAGGTEADTAIRETIVAETPEPERRFGLDSLFGFRVVQDPAAEAERLDPEAEAAELRRKGLAAPTPSDVPASGG
jgi:hypothetical protein